MLGIYTRISKDRPNQISTEVQKEEGIKLATSIGLSYKLYEEEKGTSGGKTIKQRPKLNDLVDDIYDDKITAVYFYNQDRSSRDEVTWFTLANLFIDKNISLYENGILLDLNDTDTYMLAGFKAIMNAAERKKGGKRIKDALKKLVKDGKATNPVVTYGYKKDKNGYLVLNDDPINEDGLTEVDVVKKIFKLSLDGLGSQRIADLLIEEGIPTRYANAKGTITTKNKLAGTVTTKNKSDVKWQQNTVLQILKRTWYYGKRKYKGEEYDVPAIFTKDYCDKVRDNLKNNRINPKAGSLKNNYLLRGILRCKCGCNFYGKVIPSNGENFYYCASKRPIYTHKCDMPSINRPHLDKIIWEWFFKNKTLVNLVVEHFHDTDSKEMIIELEEKLSKLQKQLKNTDEEKDEAIKLRTKKYITDDELEVQLKRIRTIKNKLDNDILNTENQLQSYRDSEKSSSEIANDIESHKNKTSYNDQQEIIHKYIKEIEVDFKFNHYVLTIKWNLPQLHNFYLVVQRRCYYVIEPFAGKFEVINKFQRKKKGKPVEQTVDEFFKSVYKEKQVLEMFKIKQTLLNQKYNLNSIDFEATPDEAEQKELDEIKKSPQFITLMKKMKMLNNN